MLFLTKFYLNCMNLFAILLFVDPEVLTVVPNVDILKYAPVLPKGQMDEYRIANCY